MKDLWTETNAYDAILAAKDREIAEATRQWKNYEAAAKDWMDDAQLGRGREAELRREIAALREALRPFAETAEGIPDSSHDAAPACCISHDALCPGTFTTINNAAFRRALTVLSASPAPVPAEAMRDVLINVRKHVPRGSEASVIIDAALKGNGEGT